MPIYEYHCAGCDKDFEQFQKMSDPPLATCPTCGGEIKRVVSQTSFALKGSGWYKDGYASSSGSSSKSPEKKKSDIVAPPQEKPAKKDG